MEKLSFDQLVFEYLIRADISKLAQVASCLKLMENNNYDIDFMPVFYTEEINKYDTHLRISRTNSITKCFQKAELY